MNLLIGVLSTVLALPAAALPDRPVVLHVIYDPAAGGDTRLRDNANVTHVTNYTAGRRLLKVSGAEDFAAQRTAVRAAPAVRAALPLAAPGLDLVLRVFGR